MSSNILQAIYMMMIVGFLFSCSGSGINPSKPHSLPHSHIFPYTKSINGYHVRLIVNHRVGKMWLVFEDISELKTQGMLPRRIFAKVILPNDQTLELKFNPISAPYVKHYRHRQHYRKGPVSLFVAQAHWIKTTFKFDLTLNFPYRGRRYPMLFKYDLAGSQ